MLISKKHKYVFLCNQKCASNSIEQMLKPYSEIALLGLQTVRHTNFTDYDRYIKPYLKVRAQVDNLETICVVREPLSWLNSWYRFRSRSTLRNPDHPNHHKSTFGMEFSEFITAYMSPDPPAFVKDLGSQFNFVEDSMGEVGVDTIFLYEDLDSLVNYMSHRVDRDLKLKNINVSPKKATLKKLYKLNFFWNSQSEQINGTNSKSQSTVKKYEISEDLLSSLHKFIHKDFELYKTLKKTPQPFHSS